jgi:predicted MFS family arabinose efflux permease
MFDNLAARLRSSDTNFRLLVPLLVSTALIQVVTALVRVTISYRAVELNASIVFLGLIAAAFAICPILIAVRIGRFLDNGRDAETNWLGAMILGIACASFTLWSSPAGLLVASTIMGIGHIMLIASQQILCVRAAGPRSMESVFGNYMVAGAIGQGLGPYVVGWVGGAAAVPPTQLLFFIGALLAAVSFAVVLTMRPRRDRPAAIAASDVVPVQQLLRIPGIASILATGIILISANDMIVIYVPLLGTERHIDVHDIGLLLTVRSAASMLARMIYSRTVAVCGRWPLMIGSTFVYAASYAAFAAPLPLWAMHVAIATMGFSFGFAATLTITIVVGLSSGAQGTANSLRIMGNRIGQFVLPFSGGLVAAVTGIAGLFLILAAAVGAAAAAMAWKRPAS